jgi:plastocyanin
MKKLLLFSVFALCSGLVLSNKVIVINSGFTFSPDSISINTTDTVVFQLGSIHTVVEVNRTTWDANGNTPLPGGFSLPSGGGQLTGLTVGVHYYVCGNHFASGMKGRIYVTSAAGINNTETTIEKIGIYPNPTNGKFSLRYGESGIHRGTTQEIKMDIYNFLGGKIFSQSQLQPQTEYEFDLTPFPAGVYFISISDGRKADAVRIVKR